MGSALLLLCAVGFSGGARAQETPRWSEVDCSQVKIAVPAGVRCRATQEYSGGQGAVWSAGPGGMFQRSSAEGTVNGVRLRYHLSEGTSVSAFVVETAPLERGLMEMSREAKEGKDFSALANRGGADFMTFVGAEGEPCVGIRKYGPSVRTGFQWILNAVRCVPRGSPASAPGIDQFIAETGYRG